MLKEVSVMLFGLQKITDPLSGREVGSYSNNFFWAGRVEGRAVGREGRAGDREGRAVGRQARVWDGRAQAI